jgi:probable F420-dependent oxidoreductase
MSLARGCGSGAILLSWAAQAARTRGAPVPARRQPSRIAAMKLDAELGVYDLAAVPEEGRRLERLGFDGLWSFETQHNPFLALAFAASGTQRLELGTNIAVAFARTPMAMAMAAWDLAQASAGRFRLGLGTQVRGHIERRFGAEWGRPAARLKEYIRCMQAIWDTFQNGSKPAFEGEFYRFKLITPFFNPGPIAHPRIPIHVAGVNPTMCRMAGEVADGFHVHPMHSVRYLRELARPALDEGARSAGKRVEELELFAPVFAITGRTPAERAERERVVREQIAFYASTPNYRCVLEVHGWVGKGEELSRLMRAGDLAGMPRLVSDEMLDAFAVSAPMDKLPGLLRTRYEGLLQRVALYYPIPSGDPEATWKAFAAAFRQAA